MSNRDREFHGIHGASVSLPPFREESLSPLARRSEDALRALDPYGTLDEKHARLSVGALRAAYSYCAERRSRCVDDLSASERRATPTGGVNPFDWSDGHVAHFYEFMVARNLTDGKDAETEAVRSKWDADALFDSFRADYGDRWRAETVVGVDPSAEECAEYRRAAARWCERLLGADDARLAGAVETYLHLYGLVHEHWHLEDYVQARNTLKYARIVSRSESDGVGSKSFPADLWGGFVEMPKNGKDFETSDSMDTITSLGYATVDVGTYRIGAERSDKWVFDAERWAHDVRLVSFRIAKTCCTNAQFAAFIEAGGYDNRSLWSHEGWRWLTKRKESGDTMAPLGWIVNPCVKSREDGVVVAAAYESWLVSYFDDAPVALKPQHPVCHVAWYEAEAYCNWIGCRLPTEVEWEAACRTTDRYAARPARRTYPWGEEPPSHERANLDAHRRGTIDVSALEPGDSAYGCRQMIGNVWEWTATAFLPYPGFQMDYPYRENSCPWFGYRKVVKGGCWATSSPIARAGYRHSFWPHMHHTFSGFRAAHNSTNVGRALCVLPQRREGETKCGNIVTMERIASHLRNNGFSPVIRSILDLPQSKEDMANVLHAMDLDLIIVLHAFKCGLVIDTVGEHQDMLPPLVLVLGGTDVNVDCKTSSAAEQIFRARVDIARHVVSFSLSMIEAAPKGSLAFVESDADSKTKLIPQGVSAPVAEIKSQTSEGANQSELDELHADSGCAAPSAPIMFLPAGLRPVKDVCYLDDALREFNADRFKVHLTVCGPDVDEEYANEVRYRLNARGECDRKLLPGVDREKVFQYISQARVVLNTSVSEGQSGIIAEAMLLGTLVCARDIPGNRNLFDLCEARACAALGPLQHEALKGDGWALHPVGILFSTPHGCFRAMDALGLTEGAKEHPVVEQLRLRAREGISELSTNESQRWTEIILASSVRER